MNTSTIDQIIRKALREDAVRQDVTTKLLIPAQSKAQASITIKENAIVCGLSFAKKVFQAIDPAIKFKTVLKDGAAVKKGETIITLQGKTQSLLTGERCALNFLSYLSGIATKTHQFVKQASGNRARILDTRKTTPGLRMLEKYAVRCGGGENHRLNLNEFVMIKDNHRTICHPQLSIPESIALIREKTNKKITIEVDTLAQFQQALEGRPDIILLDNMIPTRMRKAVHLARKMPVKQRPLLEASGGITLKNVAAIAKTGVDRISIGSLTHSHTSIDISMEVFH